MKALINNIFAEHGFSRMGGENAIFFEKDIQDRQEYFLVDFIDATQFKGYLQGEQGSEVFALFEEHKKRKKDIEKNTSLLLCIRLDTMAGDIAGLKNGILDFEENEYWFKKYTLVYTDASVPQPAEGASVMEHFNTLLLDNERFSSYKENSYADETYFLGIQLFLKLPFLAVPQHDQVNYRTISEILKDKLSEAEILFMEKLRTLEGMDAEGYWENIRAASLETGGEEEMIQAFMNKFRTDA